MTDQLRAARREALSETALSETALSETAPTRRGPRQRRLEGRPGSLQGGTRPQHLSLRQPARLLALLPLLLIPLLLFGCHERSNRHDGPHPTAYASPTEFQWTGDLISYDALDEYDWNTVWDLVFVEFEAFDFSGVIRVQIFDDDFVEILDETWVGYGDDVLIRTSSASGVSGQWRVRITSDDLWGDLALRFD
jgi:hypothetical protein